MRYNIMPAIEALTIAGIKFEDIDNVECDVSNLGRDVDYQPQFHAPGQEHNGAEVLARFPFMNSTGGERFHLEFKLTVVRDYGKPGLSLLVTT
jgi:hypothetical protein